MRLSAASVRMPGEDVRLLIVVLVLVALFFVWAMPDAIFITWFPEPITSP